MYVQYLYPVSDTTVVKDFADQNGVRPYPNGAGTLWNKVNAGVATPIDSTYASSIVPLQSTPLYYDLSFNMTPPIVVPDSGCAFLNLRYRNDEQFSTIIMYQAGFTYTEDSTLDMVANNGKNGQWIIPYTSGQWVNKSFQLYDSQVASNRKPFGLEGQLSWAGVDFNANPSPLYFILMSSGVTQTQPLKFSEIEIAVSGQYKFIPAKANTLFVGGALPLNSGTTLTTIGSAVLDSGMPLYTSGPPGTGNAMSLYTFSERKHQYQNLPMTYYDSFNHESGVFQVQNIFKDTFFDFANSGYLTPYTNPQYFVIQQLPTWDAEVGSGNLHVYYDPSVQESGFSQIFPPGTNQSLMWDSFNTNLDTQYDGTSVKFSSRDFIQTSDIIPYSGNYSVRLDFSFGYFMDGAPSANGFIPSGSTIAFDGIRMQSIGNQVIATVNGVSYPLGFAPLNPLDPYQAFGQIPNSYMVSYDGRYNFWVSANNYWTKAVTTVPMARPTSKGFAPVNNSTVTSGNMIFTCGQSNVNPPIVGTYGIQRLGVVASGISDADVRLMNKSQTSMTEILGDLAAAPSGFVRYNAYGCNYDARWAGGFIVNQAPQSFLPYGRSPSGATLSTFLDNYGTYTLHPAGSLTIAHPSLINPFLNMSGQAKVYDTPYTSILFSGWITSNFGGNYQLSLIKNDTTQNSTSQPFTGGANYYGTNYYTTTKARYKAAWDTLTLSSGRHLYTKTLSNFVEMNFDETDTTTEYYVNNNGPNVYYSQSIIQHDGGINWDNAALLNCKTGASIASGEIFNYNADINNATVWVEYLASSPPKTGVGITLYTAGQGFTTSGCDLFIKNNPVGAIDLFLKVVDPGHASGGVNLNMWTVGSSSGYAHNQTTLYTQSSVPSSGAIPLFIWSENGAPSSGKTTLYIQAPDWTKINKSVPLTVVNNGGSGAGGMPLATIATTKIHNAATLFMNSEKAGYFHGSFPMFIAGSPISGQMSLFTKGPVPTHTGMPFYVQGSTYKNHAAATLFTRNNYYDVVNGQVPLFIDNKVGDSGGITFHTLAGFYQGHIPLYLRTLEENDASGFTPLFIYSADHSGLFKSTTLYIDAVGTSERIPLYLKTEESATLASSIPLYTKAGNDFTRSVELYVESVRQSGGSVNFNVVGAGLNPDSNVARNFAPLYIARGNENFGNGVSMVIEGPSGNTASVPMSIEGGTFNHGFVTLAIPLVDGHYSGGMNLYTHGF